MADSKKVDGEHNRRAFLKRLAALTAGVAVAGITVRPAHGQRFDPEWHRRREPMVPDDGEHGREFHPEHHEPPAMHDRPEALHHVQGGHVRGGLAFPQHMVANMHGPERAMAETINCALETSNMPDALNRYGRELMPGDRQLLQVLGHEDLKYLKGLLERVGHQRLNPGKLAGHSGGLIY